MFFYLPLVIVLYQLAQKKLRWMVLLGASLIFFYMYSAYLIIFLIVTTLITYKVGIDIGKEDEKSSDKRKRKLVFFGIFMVVFILVYLKYSGFIETNINVLLGLMSLPQIHIENTWGLPIGISFYTLQAVSYLMDIYRKKLTPEKNLLKVMLYLSFFPIVIEGPVVRYDSVKDTLFAGNPIEYDALKKGLIRIVWGIFKKIVIADRLNTFVINIFDVDPMGHAGSVVLVGAIAYTVQLYMDFSGMIDVTLGMGTIFGIKLPENFRQPFFAKTVNEFWSRWHITLGTWIKDYIFYPVLISKPFKKFSKSRKTSKGRKRAAVLLNSSALFVAWFVNGLWHGTGWSFILFGMYYFVLLTLGLVFEPLIKKVHKKLNINKENIAYRLFQFIKLSIFVVIGELIFRANGGLTGLKMVYAIFARFDISAISGLKLLNYGVDSMDWIVVFIALVVVVCVSICKERNIDIMGDLMGKPIYIRWTVYYVLIFSIVIFGAYGQGYIPAEILYGKF